MINSVAIENFKNLRKIQIELDRFTVFVGPNASGKTSVIALKGAFRDKPVLPVLHRVLLKRWGFRTPRTRTQFHTCSDLILDHYECKTNLGFTPVSF